MTPHVHRHGVRGSGIAAQAMGQSSWQRTGPAHVAQIVIFATWPYNPMLHRRMLKTLSYYLFQSQKKGKEYTHLYLFLHFGEHVISYFSWVIKSVELFTSGSSVFVWHLSV